MGRAAWSRRPPLTRERKNERHGGLFVMSTTRFSTAASTGVPSLNRNFVHPILVSIPPLAEQVTIVAVLDGVEEAAEGGREERDVLQSFKAAASDALLTGHVRVPAKDGS